MVLLSAGCENPNKEFVEKHEDENFDTFTNRSFLIRSADREGNLQIFVATDKKNAFDNGPYVVTVEKKTGAIKKASTHLMSDTSSLDREQIHGLIPIFLEYKVYSLSVDTDQNVYVRLKEADRPTLIRFSDMKHKTKEYKDWKQVKGNWYEKKE
jgi:hypothetical protein